MKMSQKTAAQGVKPVRHGNKRSESPTRIVETVEGDQSQLSSILEKKKDMFPIAPLKFKAPVLKKRYTEIVQ